MVRTYARRNPLERERVDPSLHLHSNVLQPNRLGTPNPLSILLSSVSEELQVLAQQLSGAKPVSVPSVKVFCDSPDSLKHVGSGYIRKFCLA